MKNIKLSVLALTVFVATAVSASEPEKTVAPKVEVPAATQTSDASKAVVKTAGYLTKVKEAVSSAYTATKNGACKLGSAAYNNKWKTFGVVAVLGAAVVYRKEIAKLAKKAFNAAKNNPGRTAAVAVVVAALGAAHYYGYDVAALNKVTSLFSSKAATEVVDAAAKTATNK